MVGAVGSFTDRRAAQGVVEQHCGAYDFQVGPFRLGQALCHIINAQDVFEVVDRISLGIPGTGLFNRRHFGLMISDCRLQIAESYWMWIAFIKKRMMPTPIANIRTMLTSRQARRNKKRNRPIARMTTTTTPISVKTGDKVSPPIIIIHLHFPPFPLGKGDGGLG